MGANKKLTMWYIRISRVFGVFPITRSADGSLTFSVFSLATVYSVTVCLCYTVSMGNFIYGGLKQEQLLSYRLTVLSSTVGAVLTGYLICISSLYYSKDLVKLLAITQKSKFRYGGQWRIGYWCIVPMLHFVCGLINFILYGFLFPESYDADILLAPGPGWYRLLGFGTALFEFCHVGMFLSALCFLIIFGKGVASCFELLCERALELCRSTMVSTHPGHICIAMENEAPSFTMHNPVCETETVKMVLLVKDAFEIYLKIGGAFTFALVTETGTWLFYLVCAVLFSAKDSYPSFALPMMICQATTVVLALVTVAELGHQIASQV